MGEIVEYGIAVAANATDVAMHEYAVESNRVRLVLSGSEEQLEAFMETLTDDHACGLTKDRRLWCWGADDEGQLGGTTQLSPTPVKLPRPSGMPR